MSIFISEKIINMHFSYLAVNFFTILAAILDFKVIKINFTALYIIIRSFSNKHIRVDTIFMLLAYINVGLDMHVFISGGQFCDHFCSYFTFYRKLIAFAKLSM